MTTPFFALSLFATAIMTLTIERVMRVFFEKRRTSFPVAFLSYLFFWIALSLQFFVESIPFVILLYLLALIVISLNYEAVIIHRMSAVAGSYFILNATTVIFHFLFYVFPDNLLGNSLTIAFTSAIMLSYLIVLLIFSRFKNIKKATTNLYKIWLPFLIIAGIHVFFGVFTQLNIPYTTAIYSLTSSLGIAFIIFYLYNHLSKSFNDNIKSALHAQEKEYYFTQCQLMQESVEQMKAFRHDLKLHLATARDYSTNNKAVEAADYLNKLLGDIGTNEVYSDTGNIAFDSIINYKLKNIKNTDTKLDLRISIPPVLNVEAVDIVTILGNLLDNALDAIAKN